jgi:prepilin-type N-terminal cleavage/methylation domain-containing protein
MQISNNRKSGFTLVEIMIVVAIIGLLAAIAIPNFVKARNASQTSACIANLKQLEGAVATWALENKKTAAATVASTDIIGTDKYIKVMPLCPAGGTYVYSPIDTRPTCNIANHTLQ